MRWENGSAGRDKKLMINFMWFYQKLIKGHPNGEFDTAL